jgi:hypothetical protein
MKVVLVKIASVVVYHVEMLASQKTIDQTIDGSKECPNATFVY